MDRLDKARFDLMCATRAYAREAYLEDCKHGRVAGQMDDVAMASMLEEIAALAREAMYCERCTAGAD